MILRAFSLLLTLVVLFVASRYLIRTLPGDPFETILSETGTRIDPQLLREELGLDRPFLNALGTDVAQIIHGNWGLSLHSRQPILQELLPHFLATLELSALAMALGLTISLILGLSANTTTHPKFRLWSDRACSQIGAIAIALPTPWVGPILIYVFAVLTPVAPVQGGLILPAIALSLGFVGFWSRWIRDRVHETLKIGSAPGARARGVPEWKVLLKYGLAPSSGPMLAFLGTQAGSLLTGAFVTEAVFNRTGMGTWFIDAVLSRDYPVVEASVLVGGITCLLGTAIGDWMQWKIDPRKSSH